MSIVVYNINYTYHYTNSKLTLTKLYRIEPVYIVVYNINYTYHYTNSKLSLIPIIR